MEKSLRFFERELAMKRVADLRVNLPRPNALLSTTPGQVRIALLELPASSLAGIRLVEAGTPVGQSIRDNARPNDYGFFDMAFAAEDTRAIHRQLTATGHRCKDVVEYELPSPAAVTIRESLCRGPDGVNAVFLQRIPGDGRMRGLSGVLSSVRTVAKAEATVEFYRKLLGFEVRSDHVYDSDGVRHIVDLPPGGKLRIVALQAPEGSRGRVLLFEFYKASGMPLPGKDLAARERPGHAGIYLWSFEVENLDATVQRAIAAGASLQCPPRHYSFPPYHGARAATVQAPDGARLEFIEAGTASEGVKARRPQPQKAPRKPDSFCPRMGSC